jgi:hypothetical protein
MAAARHFSRVLAASDSGSEQMIAARHGAPVSDAMYSSITAK